ncbi:universal stress family protein [Myxococcus stipitatus DSM 14675]|uniref:Universal stress family protein n=1 Tax=Myxococcus stipitatus (strain DSM 14675 / JCM 12634 / Mx s8) TaxID=1278073 RepID=L7UJY9_MYXSD|nr:universal stress protein [Myxococcus stipitatus]AGC49316.1 universal stress family protein [Myxococcus stipitatus DSM 14675]
MAIVCASPVGVRESREVEVAAALAARLGEPLLLVGVMDGEPLSDTTRIDALRALEAQAARLELPPGQVACRVRSDMEVVLAEDECRQSRWIVAAAEGWRTSTWRRASLPERLARRGCGPVLVVRRADALVDWVRGRRRLLVLVGVDPLSPTADAAVGFLRELRRVGPCDVLATYVFSPLEERERLGIHTPVHVDVLEPGARDMEALDPAVETVLLREVREQVGDLEGEGRVEVVLEPGYGRPADHLLHVALTRGADLVVVGMRSRGPVKRLWHGSISAGVLRHSEQAVVCVPDVLNEPRHALPPRSVLVPVDFSDSCMRAISQARSLVGPGGRVHLLHVHRKRLGDTAFQDHYGVLPEPAREREEMLRRLWGLVPRDESARAQQWSVEGVSGEDVALAICQATEREGVDLVCVGTPGGPVKGPDTLPGAVTKELVARCRRPVMVVPAA